jgi:hypothetical protein
MAGVLAAGVTYVVARLFMLHRGALITACIVSGLVLLGAVSQAAGTEDSGPFSAAESDCFNQRSMSTEEVLAVIEQQPMVLSEVSPALRAVAQCKPDSVVSDEAVLGFQRASAERFGTAISLDESRCIMDQTLRQLQKSEDLIDGLRDSAGVCLTAETTEAIQAAAVARDLERLASGCREGSDIVCDLLFLLAPADSAERSLAESCAGRPLQSPTFCAGDLVDEDSNGFADEVSPGLTSLTAECTDGAMATCDALSVVAELDSESFEAGASCGGRRSPSALNLDEQPWCVDAFGEAAS